jgi:hypothetical protein
LKCARACMSPCCCVVFSSIFRAFLAPCPSSRIVLYRPVLSSLAQDLAPRLGSVSGRRVADPRQGAKVSSV